MAEYLSPGVYVEEFDSGNKAMEGVSTSTAGFIGMTEKGPISGKPVLITGLGEYQRVFGGYLSINEYGPNCYLPYAVESFFINGGSSCYVMRVASKNSKVAEKLINLSTTDSKNYGVIQVDAANVGKWGNKVSINISKTYSNKTTVSHFAVISEDDKKYALTVKSSSGYTAGDIVQLTKYVADGNITNAYLLLDGIDGNILNVTSSETLDASIVDTSAIPNNYIQLYALSIQAYDDTQSEDYPQAVLNSASPIYLGKLTEKSKLITVAVGKPDETTGKATGSISYALSDLFEQLVEDDGKAETDGVKSYTLSGGEDNDTKEGLTPDLLTDASRDFPGKRIGLDAFKELKDVSIMAIPGQQSDVIQALLIAHCENLANRFAVLDAGCDENEVSQLTLYKDKIDSTYCSIYQPWIQIYSAIEKKNMFVPPSGAIAGIYARTDTTRGVWKAPANEIVKNCTGLSVNFNEAEQGKLNPKGINLIRAIPNSGIRVWGARTLSSDGNWKYVNVRRLFIYVEESIRNSLGWAVFEPNDANLWSRVQGTIRVFLTTLWRNGALFGSSPEEAFYVNVGKGSTMTDDDINNGRLICEIGIAPVKPAEFVVFRITQKMQDSQ
ncbi:MAG: phage tail sheath subtilisin-like domain-containing protein [Eubacterium sp.]|jgi:phage tail sheath protein FI|nr:phage tail sheath subtilisin-like domain-containing protein [Eubacterium sp.]